MEKKYEWRMSSLAKGIDPDEAIKELERIELLYGSLTPEHVLDASKKEDDVLHKLFVWNDEHAAHQYRLQQARQILNNIEINIISDGQSKIIPVYEVVTVDNARAYKHVETFTDDNVNEIKSRTIKELNALRQKLSIYQKFDKAIEKLGEAVDTIASV